MILTLVHIIFALLFALMLVNVLYLFISAVAGRFRKTPVFPEPAAYKRIAVCIPSYKEDNIIVHSARSAKSHDYPADRFEVFVAAHGLQPQTVAALRAIPVQVLEVDFELGSKARSLNKLLNHIPEKEYDIAIILDADNIMLPGCLKKVNQAFQAGSKAVQVHRIAKNRNSAIAVLDGLSEEVNNHLFRQGQRGMGLSSVTIGSGMSFEFWKIREIYNKPGILGNPACDREVDYEMTKADICIEYLPDAYVLDEKVARDAVYEKQRTRWLESQIIHLRLFFNPAEKPKVRTRDYWNRLFINLIPPRLLFLALFAFIFVIYAIEYGTGTPLLYPAPVYWLGMALIYIFSFVIAIPRSFYTMQTLSAIAHVPVIMLSMIRALFRMNADRKEFLHTPKSFTQETAFPKESEKP